MQLENEFRVPVPVAQAWQVLLDVQRIAPCMPGATVDRVEGDEIAGRVKVKVGPVMMSYAGTARFVEKDEQGRRLTIEGSGRETRGSGTAAATIEARLYEQESSTRVTVRTDLNVTGKPAQFGRGVMADVAGKLIDQFAACLADLVGAPTMAEAAQTTGVAAPGTPAEAPARTMAPEPERATAAPAAPQAQPRPSPPAQAQEAIDLVGALGMPVLKQLAPALVGLMLGFLLGSVLGRRRRLANVVAFVPWPPGPAAYR